MHGATAYPPLGPPLGPGAGAPAAAIRVPRGQDLLGGLICRWPGLWVRAGELESELLAARLDALPIERPVYICGLARAGSTILLELLAGRGGLAAHRYRDFPPLYTPYLWNRLLDRLPKKPAAPVERSHRDGLMVTPESPEAFEEVLWMTFFPRCHAPGASHVLDARAAHPRFEAFYRAHLRKLVLARGARRYLAKNNYAVTRLGYLRKLFPDARFVLPVRAPEGHVASLVKQHRLFRAAETANPRVLAHMRRVGHFEFGLDRRPIETGEGSLAREIAELWQDGEDLRGYARQWRQVYGYLARALAAEPALAEAALVVRFEDLCRRPRATLEALGDHCALDLTGAELDALAARLRAPNYYTPDFTAAQRALIARETQDVAPAFGY